MKPLAPSAGVRPVATRASAAFGGALFSVALLRSEIAGAQIGTVDKFQGQEAPVVIYSMATSSAEDAPRGAEFLYSANRLNVGLSRARCASFLVASPRLFERRCQTVRQVELVSAFCRYIEVSREVRVTFT